MANLITNGDFTAGSSTGWSNSSRAYFANDGGCDTGVYPDGMVVFQNEGVGGMRDIGQNVTGMVAGRTYTLSFYAKQVGRYDAWAGYDYWELNGAVKTVHFPSKESELKNNQWVKLTYQFTWPSNVQSTACIRIRAGADSWDGWTQLLVDKVVLDDGQGGGGTGPTPIGFYYTSNTYLNDSQKATNAQCILNYLRSRGWSKNAICGMLGNFEKESTINPGLWQNREPNNLDNAFGLPQWRPSRTYVNWANQNGYTIGAMDAQLDRLEWEVNTGQGGKYDPVSPYLMTFPQFKTSMQSVDYLARAFLYNYEKAGSGSEAERVSYAVKWWNSLV